MKEKRETFHTATPCLSRATCSSLTMIPGHPLTPSVLGMGTLRNGTALPSLAAKVAAGELDPYAAADQLLSGLDQ